MAEADDWPCWPSATVPLAHAGLLVAGRYRLLAQVGVGAMGAVWLGTDQRLNRQVALKQVVLERGLDPRQASEARQRILREGRIAARLQHPHAVAVYDVTMQDGEPWLVMEYLRARSLASVITLDGPLTDRAVARIGAQVADALEAAHKVGIVHRDVKPGNVLLCPDGSAKLADFGIARASGDITVTQTGVLTGTPEYSAPEVARGGRPTPAADVFSLGATLYSSVEGRPPFDLSGNALAQMEVIASGSTIPPRRAGRLAPLLTRLLDPDPARRPSAGEARAMLEAELIDVAATGPAREVPPPRSGDRPGIPPRPVPGADEQDDEQGSTGLIPKIPAPTGVLPPPPGASRHAAPSSSKSRRWLVGGLATAAVLTALVAVSIVVGDRRAPIEPANTAASATNAAGGAAAARPPTQADLTAAVRDYYQTLPDNTSAAWARLTPKARDEVGGSAAFTGFWRPVKWVRVVGTTVSVPDRTVRAQLRLQNDNGQARTVLQRLVFVPGPNGDWLIDTIGNG
jgi:eukaryotic-like serine/threonine-protein kinase